PNTAPIASKKANVTIIINGTYTICQVGVIPNIIKNNAITTVPNKKFTSCVIVNDNGKINFGKYTWLIIELYRRIEFADVLIDELIQRQTTSPITKKTA